jgi:hypothetical protein
MDKASIIRTWIVVAFAAFCVAVMIWLDRQDHGLRDDWLGRLALLGLFSPLAAFLLPTTGGVCILIAGFLCFFTGLRYLGDMGAKDHFIVAGFLVISACISFVGSLVGMNLRSKLKHGSEIETVTEDEKPDGET